MPLSALFSGMRLNEICVKTEAGVRFVPVHPELRKIGLLAYVDERRRTDKPNAPAFPDLPAGSTGYRSNPFSKFFARFLDHDGVKHPKKVFHLGQGKRVSAPDPTILTYFDACRI